MLITVLGLSSSGEARFDCPLSASRISKLLLTTAIQIAYFYSSRIMAAGQHDMTEIIGTDVFTATLAGARGYVT